MLTKVLKGRGAQGIVEINGEALFLTGSDVNRWSKRFQERLYAAYPPSRLSHSSNHLIV